MIVNEIDQSKLFSPIIQQRIQNDPTYKPEDTTFVDALKSFIKDVDNQQHEANDMTEKLIKGEAVDLHDVMISAEKAKTTFTLMMEIRNKFLDVYREAMRMQV